MSWPQPNNKTYDRSQYRVDFNPTGHAERDAKSARRAASKSLLRGRLIQDGERTYHAYSADELIEIDSLAHHGRPGMPY